MTIKARFKVVKKNFTLDVDVKIPSQGITAVFGASGCGKTTLLRSIAGLEICSNGFLKVGEDLWQDGKFRVPTHKRSIGYVFQEASLFAHLKVRGNLEYGIKRIPLSKRKVSLERAIELLGLEALLERREDQLSGGERQRVAIGRALAVSPQILLMDEPLSALDHARKQEIMPYLESLHDELDIPVIYVSHSPEEVARLADHLILLESGRVRAEGGISEMLSRLDLPLAQGDEAAVLIEASIAGHDEHFNLSYLDFPGGRVTVARRDLSLGHPVRLRIAAQDVSLTLKVQTGTSILNIFPAIVEEIIPEGAFQVVVKLMVGGVPMLSRITKKSASLLDLSKGSSVYAQVKSVVLLS